MDNFPEGKCVLDDKYAIIRPLGAGGFSKVYIVSNMAGEKFAAKILKVKR
jgi:serine/threonine protein kinase